MFKVAEARFLAPSIKLFRVEAPRIARRRLAGQFLIVRLDEHGERIPLTIADSDPADGTVTIVVQGVGKTTQQLNLLEAGDAIRDVVGPLGEASETEYCGNVVVIGGGVGSAIAYPTAVAFKNSGNHVVSILGARSQEFVILEDELRATSDECYVMTDDGSYGEQGFVTQKLTELLEGERAIDRVLAIGPIPMMQAVANATRPHGVKTIVSLNPIMVDGTGMCGGCRVSVGGQSRFACVDGPEFDAHQVDFKTLAQRNTVYRGQEQQSLHDMQACENQDGGHGEACRLRQAASQSKTETA